VDVPRPFFPAKYLTRRFHRLWFHVVDKLAFDRDSCRRKTFVCWDPVFNAVAREFAFGRS
jgi:hypothetical protein